MTAFVRGPIAASVARRSRANEQASRSTNTGAAPVATTAFADAMNVRAGTITSSPGPTPAATSAICSAAVPELAATARSVPTKEANSASKAATSGPAAIWPERRTRSTASSSAEPTAGAAGNGPGTG